jgi:molecular chaperone DnaJ
MNDLYAILGVPKTAAAEEIKKAYREKALQYHPDRNSGDAAAEEQFKKISEAYAVLGDEEKRAQYDAYGQAGTNPYGQPYNQPNGQPYGNPFGQAGYDPFEELFRQQANRTTYTWYTYGPSRESRRNRNTPASRKQALLLLLKGVSFLVMGLFFFRYSLFLGIIGLLICGSLIAGGAADAIRAIQYLLNGHRKT